MSLTSKEKPKVSLSIFLPVTESGYEGVSEKGVDTFSRLTTGCFFPPKRKFINVNQVKKRKVLFTRVKYRFSELKLFSINI